jgi:hypothetical protein
MAIRREPRAGERGLSLIEALVVVTVTAMLALLLLPMVSTAAGRNFARADRALDAVESARAETAFRGLLRAVAQDQRTPFAGAADTVSLLASPGAAIACAEAGAPRLVRLSIVRTQESGRLLCSGEGGEVELLRWAEGEARFSYSRDGAAWAPAWTQPPAQSARGGAAPVSHAAPFVRFDLVEPGRPSLAWIEQAGSSEATRLDAERAS